MAPIDLIPDLTGEFVGSRYEFIQLLGSGAYGVVYKAFDHCLCQDVAVKVLCISGRTEAQRKLIMRETQLNLYLAIRNTEGVVRLLDVVYEHEWCNLVFEFCPNGHLYTQITKKSYAGNNELLRKAFLSLIDAVEALHEAGVAHQDLKPENIMTNKDGSELYLADLGLATDEAMSNEFCTGTYKYMSPECIGEVTAYQPYNPFTNDIWSMGVLLVNMLSGCNPWQQAVPTDESYGQFIMDPDFLYHALPISEGANTIIRSIFLHPSMRISLRDLRAAIQSLETFFREIPQCEYIVPEHELPTTELPTNASNLESIFEAPEFDISCAASESVVRVAQDHSAGSAIDAQFFVGTGGIESCLGSRASSGLSSREVITPEGTVPTTTVFPSKAIMWGAQMMVDAHLSPYISPKMVTLPPPEVAN